MKMNIFGSIRKQENQTIHFFFMFLWIIPFVKINHFQDVSRCSCCQGFIYSHKKNMCTFFVHSAFCLKSLTISYFPLMIIFCDHLDICLEQILSCRRNFTRSSSPWTSATFGPPPAHKGILFFCLSCFCFLKYKKMKNIKI